MRKLIYLISAGFVYYLSVMYHFDSLLLLAIAELLLFPVFFVQSRYFKRHLQAAFEKNYSIAYKGRQYLCPVQVKYRGKIPISRFRLVLKPLSPGYLKQKKIVMEGSMPGAKSRNVMVPVEAKHCGIFHLSFQQLLVYDYVSLFCARKKKVDESIIYVLPEPFVMQVVRRETGGGNQDPMDSYFTGKTQNDSQEIRQFREYQNGDLARAIHWKLSIKTDNLLVKEYEHEENPSVQLYLEMKDREHYAPEEMDAFYEIVFSLLLGLLGQSFQISAFFPAGEGRLHSRQIYNEKQCRELLMDLYGHNQNRQAPPILQKASGASIRLNLDLCLTVGSGQKLQFSHTKYREELKSSRITI